MPSRLAVVRTSCSNSSNSIPVTSTGYWPLKSVNRVVMSNLFGSRRWLFSRRNTATGSRNVSKLSNTKSIRLEFASPRNAAAKPASASDPVTHRGGEPFEVSGGVAE